MKKLTKELLAVTLAGTGLVAAAALQASPSEHGAEAQSPHSGAMMSGGSMMDGQSGGMMGMMQQMNRMMESCNDMMASHGQHGKDPEPAHKPAG